jgi:hypothetical protein
MCSRIAIRLSWILPAAVEGRCSGESLREVLMDLVRFEKDEGIENT